MELSARPQEAEIPSLSYSDLALQFDSKLEEFQIGVEGVFWMKVVYLRVVS